MTDKELNGFFLSISETDTYKKATGAHEFEVEGTLDFFASYRVTARGKGCGRWRLTSGVSLRRACLPTEINKYMLLIGTC